METAESQSAEAQSFNASNVSDSAGNRSEQIEKLANHVFGIFSDSQGALEEETVDDVSSDRASLIEGARNNLDFLAALILTEIYEYGYPPLFHAIWQLITVEAGVARGKPKYALGIPRGFSKTVVLKLYVVWLILFSNRRFILVVCNTAKLAENFLFTMASTKTNRRRGRRLGVIRDLRGIRTWTASIRAVLS